MAFLPLLEYQLFEENHVVEAPYPKLIPSYNHLISVDRAKINPNQDPYFLKFSLQL